MYSISEEDEIQILEKATTQAMQSLKSCETRNTNKAKLNKNMIYHQTTKISGTLLGNKIVDHLDVVGAGAKSPVGTAPTTSSFST